MPATCLEHPAEATLERYLLNHASAEEFNVVETHLFACERCLDRVDEIQEFRTSLRDGFALLKEEAEQQREAGIEPRRTYLSGGRGLLKWIAAIAVPRLASVPRWAYVPAMSALLLGLFLLPNLRGPNSGEPGGAAFDVSLSAMRGDESGPVVPAGRQIEFHLNLEGLKATAFSVQVVDSDGRPVGPSQTVAGSERLGLTHPAFTSGSYFLRVYPAKDGDPDQNQLLREFPFQAR